MKEPVLKHGKDLSEEVKKAKEEKERQERMGKCQVELMEVLKKHDCSLDAIMTVGRLGNIPQVSVVANKKE